MIFKFKKPFVVKTEGSNISPLTENPHLCKALSGLGPWAVPQCNPKDGPNFSQQLGVCLLTTRHGAVVQCSSGAVIILQL